MATWFGLSHWVILMGVGMEVFCHSPLHSTNQEIFTQQAIIWVQWILIQDPERPYCLVWETGMPS